MKPTNLKVLFVEDNEDDCFMLRRNFAEGGFVLDWQRVESGPAMKMALEKEWDMIVCDYHLPTFNVFGALKVYKESDLDIPFIVISGSVGEETAVQVMKAGAHDYILKDKLARLIPAVTRELNQSKTRKLLRDRRENIQQGQKMESIGLLAGGVAHDFNNLLASIIIYCEMILNEENNQTPHRRYIEQILKASHRGATLTRQLLAFCRKQVLSPRVVNLNPIVVNLEQMLFRLIGDNIILTTELTPGLGNIKIDPNQLEQVILNLVINSRDAMPEGGKISIRTRAERITHRDEFTPGNYLVLEVSDSGCGMSPEVLKRIFEPFFTTKGPDKGTGLGLATVYGIIKQSGSHIEVESQVNIGTTFRIYFSETHDQMSVERDEKISLPSKITDSPVVLLVEDEADLRNTLGDFLKQNGFTVLISGNAPEAVKILTETKSIDLVISDISMPYMNGLDLVKEIKKFHPRTQIVLMSGYLNDYNNESLQRGNYTFLQKPFPTSELLTVVGKLLRET